MDRRNWKADLSKEAQERNKKRMQLLTELDTIRELIAESGTDFKWYDTLKQTQREIIAELATL